MHTYYHNDIKNHLKSVSKSVNLVLGAQLRMSLVGFDFIIYVETERDVERVYASSQLAADYLTCSTFKDHLASFSNNRSYYQIIWFLLLD